MHKTLIGIGAFILFVFPVASQAAGPESFDLLLSDDIYLKEEVSTFTLLRGGQVLGASTDDSNTPPPTVTKKLDKAFTSYFRDISIKPPKGWYSNDDFGEDDSFVTYIVNDEMTAQVTIFRYYDEDTTLKSLEKETEDMCELCGYGVIKKGDVKLGKLKGRYIEANSDDSHFLLYLFDIGDVSYIIQTSALIDEWDAYKSILAKSYKSIKINPSKLTTEEKK